MKTVAIVGAGPSGLVAAKTLLRSKNCRYQVRIFEKTADIGGLWAVNKDRPYDGMLNPEMPTNLSRFNIGFSDLAWSSIGLEDHIHYWPKAWQVNEYLKAYVKRYIPDNVFLFNAKVTYAGLARGDGSAEKWRIRWRLSNADAQTEDHEELFDHLIVATGLFGASSMPSFPKVERLGVKIIHSTKLRSLQDVLPDGNPTGGTILVVGGGMSGGDAATVLATQLSDAMYAPAGNEAVYKSMKLVQLCTDRAYALPLAAPSNKTYAEAPEFLPLDLCMYQLGTRPPGHIEMSVGKASKDTIQMIHDAFQGIVGDQSDLKVSSLTYNDTSRAAYVTLTELYSGFIRSGMIDIVQGRLSKLSVSDQPGKIQATYHNGDHVSTIDDVIGIVYATGFTPQPSLDFLAPEIQNLLEHDPNHDRLPILLDEHATLTHEIPSLAIVGFHEGAFWGSMEMEARLVETRWSSTTHSTGDDGDSQSTKTDLVNLRHAMNNKEADVPQYWMGDYVGLMETIARQIGIQREDFDWTPRTGPISVFRYTNDTNDRSETAQALQEYLTTLQKSQTQAAFAPRASFLGMQGHWKIERSIDSFLDSMPSGTLTGEASFHPRYPTSPGYDFEYLYIERGAFQMSNGMTMQASRQYVYRYHESTDQITVWFVKMDGKSVDYMYHGLTFDCEDRNTGWLAKADHLCVADMYRSDYRFKFTGANLSSLVVTHAVKGPKKDYISKTLYTR